MKNWRNFLVLNIGLLLVLGSFAVYGVRIAQTIIPAGSTPQQIEQLTQQYGLDRPVIEQYGTFLFMFLPGLTLLGIYGTVGLRRRDFQHWILTKIFIVFMLFTNTITILNYLVLAHASAEVVLQAFWLSLVVAGLGLANFAFLLVVWNGYKWGMWGFGISVFLMFIFKFVGKVPIFPSLFELSAVVVLYLLVRPAWSDMD